MKVSFEYTLKDFKKYLLRSRLINNIILFIIGMFIYIYLTIKTISLVFLPLFAIALLILIVILNWLYVFAQIKANEIFNNNIYGKYVLELSNNKFSVTINKVKTDYKYSNIRKIKIKKDLFMIKFKGSREFLTFEKRFFNKADYNKIINLFKEKIN